MCVVFVVMVALWSRVGAMVAAVIERDVLGKMGLPEISETVMGLRGHDASLPPCVAATWSLPVMGEKSVFCRFEDLEAVPPSLGSACPNMARWYAAVLPFVSGRVVSGALPTWPSRVC